MSRTLLCVLLMATGIALADDPPEKKPAEGAAEAEAKGETKAEAKAKQDANLGMSILGNQEAPKSLVIVPWKSSEIGKSLGISTMLDDSRNPIDKEVFMRVLTYHQLMSTTPRHDGAAAGGHKPAGAVSDAPQPATAAPRRKS